MIRIREEQPEDIPAIREVSRRAFGQPQEAELVDKLRRNCNNVLSLVALMEDQVVGHALFTPASIESAGGAIEGMGLAPMAVLPEYQRRGIGSKLIVSGIAKLASRRRPFVIVLGHADYYPRFGFERASRYNIRSQWKAPDDVFMILVLDKSEIRDIPGVAKYRPEFAEAI